MDFDRAVEDVGNVAMLEHVNLRVPDLWVARTFYVHALGLTSDPFVDHGPQLMWFNVGHQQFHVPRADERADVLRGEIELVVPSLDSLVERLDRTEPHLANTNFSYQRTSDGVTVRGPWGNTFRCVEPRFSSDTQLGIHMVEFHVPSGTTPGIARFYEQVIGCAAMNSDDRCDISVGADQVLAFVETDDVGVYDGHHLAVYLRDFSRPHQWLAKNGLVVEESDQHQYRFNWIVDPDTLEPLFEVEHEVRSMNHPLCGRPLVNKNSDQRVAGYLRGADAFVPRSDLPAKARQK